MTNSLNTDWKLTNLRNTTAFWTADSSKIVDSQVEAVKVDWHEIRRPMDDQNNWLSWGLDGRDLTIQGTADYDTDANKKKLWQLSAAVNGKELMKWWAGEDWFIYVIGRECKITRVDEYPSLARFQASLIAADPFWYCSNSDQGSGSGINLPVPKISACTSWGGSPSLSIDLTDGPAPLSAAYVEPVFWCVGGASCLVTALRIQDEQGGILDASFPSTVTSKTYIIAPYWKTSMEGFMISDAAIIQLAGGSGITAPTGTGAGQQGSWGMDGINDAYYYPFLNPTTASNCQLSQSSSYQKKIKAYPKARDGHADTLSLTPTGGTSEFAVYAQYLWRRL